MEPDSALAEALVAMVDGLDLSDTLRRILQGAVQLCGARYGALGVLDEDGGLDQFLHLGMTDEAVAGIGVPPSGRGLLGEVTRSARPLRVPQIQGHPASVGFPPGHPQMESFLGVPIVAAGRTFGRLYLTDKPGGFDADDEKRVVLLAAAAGVALDNAQLFVAARTGEAHQAAVAAMSQAALAEDADDVFQILCTGARTLVAADAAAVATLRGEDLLVEVVDIGPQAPPRQGSARFGDAGRTTAGAGPDPDGGSPPASREVAAPREVAGTQEVPLREVAVPREVADEAAGIVGPEASGPGADRAAVEAAVLGWITAWAGDSAVSRCVSTAGVTLDRLDESIGGGQYRQVGCVPIASARHDRAFGALVLLWRDFPQGQPAAGMAAVRSLAQQAATALALDDARRAADRLRVFRDRDRIARDLHDLVVQRLFASGMSLQVLVRTHELPPSARDRVDRVVADIDATITQIRETIFELREDPANRRRLTDLLADEAAVMDDAYHLPAHVVVSAELTDAQYEDVVGDIVAVVREGLSNAARHSGAAQVRVLIAADDATLTVRVVDDGRGPSDPQRRSGLANLHHRAAARNGRCELTRRAEGGAELLWRVRLPEA